MSSLNKHLEQLAQELTIRKEEKEKIDTSIETVKSRLLNEVRINKLIIKQIYVFGSYSRDISLPKDINSNADVDLMIVLEDNTFQEYAPQTCLTYLRESIESKYPSSEIFQSHPTVVLLLNHIRIELVPAIPTFWFPGLGLRKYKIPGKESNYSSWIETDLEDLSQNISKKNTPTLKNLIRIIKYWNLKNNRPFDSFLLENQICKFYTHLAENSLITRFFLFQLKDLFFNFFQSFDTTLIKNKAQVSIVNKTQEKLTEIKSLESKESSNKSLPLPLYTLTSHFSITSLDTFKKFLPLPSLVKIE